MAFELEGLNSLISVLTAMSSENFAADALQEGLMKAGKQVKATAKQLCPVAEGQLRNSIEVARTEVGVDIGTNVEYAPYVEYGTGQRGDQTVSHREDWVGMSPQPFLFPALKANQSNIAKIVSDTLQSKINEQVK